MLIYFIDDHKLFAEAMKLVVTELFPQCHIKVFTNADLALKNISSKTPDIILLDLEMADVSGLMLLETLSQNGKNIPVLVCSGNLSEANKQRVLSAGALGFLSKAEGTDDIRKAIKRVVAGESYPENIDRYLEHAPPSLLSNRQRAILNLMQSGMANADIAEMLCLSTNTIKTHVRLMYNTLDVSSRIECLNKARELGLIDQV